jgi:monofunctional biosynthetic peptidoglycan transglycosylase
MYLNIAEFGSGTYGVSAAASRFFHHTAAQITPSEGALLAAVLPSPKHLRADRPSAYLQRRTVTILSMETALGGTGYLKTFESSPPPAAATAGSAAPRRHSQR